MVRTLGLEGLNGCCCVGLLSAGLPSDLSGKPATCWAIDFHWAGLCDPCYISEQSHQHQPNSHSKECILSSTMLGIACTHGHKQPCMDHRICHQVCCVCSLLITKVCMHCCMQLVKDLLAALKMPCHFFWVKCAFSFLPCQCRHCPLQTSVLKSG